MSWQAKQAIRLVKARTNNGFQVRGTAAFPGELTGFFAKLAAQVRAQARDQL